MGLSFVLSSLLRHSCTATVVIAAQAAQVFTAGHYIAEQYLCQEVGQAGRDFPPVSS